MSDPVIKDDLYARFAAVPQHQVAEIIRGRLVTHPHPAIPHAAAASALTVEIFGPFWRGKGGPGGWVLLAEPELHLAKDILVPDLAGWRRERMVTIPDTPFIDLSPDWVCEVLSPSTEAIDRIDKLPIYAAHQVQYVWLVDPLARTLEIFKLIDGRWTLLGAHRDAARVRAEPFDAIEIELAVLWER